MLKKNNTHTYIYIYISLQESKSWKLEIRHTSWVFCSKFSPSQLISRDVFRASSGQIRARNCSEYTIHPPGPPGQPRPQGRPACCKLTILLKQNHIIIFNFQVSKIYTNLLICLNEKLQNPAGITFIVARNSPYSTHSEWERQMTILLVSYKQQMC